MSRLPLRYRPLAAFVFAFVLGGVPIWALFALSAGSWTGAPLLIVGVAALICGGLGLASYDRSLREPAPRRWANDYRWGWISMAVGTYSVLNLFADTVVVLQSLPVRGTLFVVLTGLNIALDRRERRRKALVAAGELDAAGWRWWRRAHWLFLASFITVPLVGLVGLFAPCSPLDLPRRLAGCVGGVGQPESVAAAAFSATGALLATGDHAGQVQLWSLPQRRPVRSLAGAQRDIAALAFAPDDRYVAAGSWDQRVYLWRVADGALVRTIQHASFVESVAFSPDGELLASVDMDDTLIVTTVADGRVLLRRDDSKGETLRFAPDSRTLLAVGRAGVVESWDVGAGRLARSWTIAGDPITQAISADASLIAVSHVGGPIEVWRVADQTLLRRLDQPAGWARALAFSPDKTQLASAGSSADDAARRVWRLADGSSRQLADRTFSADALAFAPDSATLAVAAYKHTTLWQTP